MKPKIAFSAPLKSPNHPIPSGDREIARNLLKALDLAGFDAFLASESSPTRSDLRGSFSPNAGRRASRKPGGFSICGAATRPALPTCG